LQQSFIQFSWITGGNNGIAFIPRPSAVLGLSFDTARGFFILVLVITAIVAVGLRALDRSRIGRTIKAVAANEQLSESLGIDAWRYRTLAFVTGSTIAGLAGVLLASFNGIINPIDFGPAFMFKIVAAAIVGGTTTFAGPLLGLAYLTGLEELFRGTAEYIPLLWGVSVIAALLLTRGGLEAILMRAFRRPAGAASRGRGA
jgi:branched-chain amino acid transport system permease protein